MAARRSKAGKKAKKAKNEQDELALDQALRMLEGLVDFDQVDDLYPVRGNAVYKTSIVLWMLVYQRMSPDSSLDAVVQKLIACQPRFLPNNKRVREGKLSPNTGAYSQARTRLPLEAAKHLCDTVARSLIEASQASFGDRRVFLIDGTTFALAPEPALRKAFPPASNQHGEGAWPIALITVCHELGSGAALTPEIGPMYGPNAVSETAQIANHLARLPPDAIVMADSGFGIFRVAHQAQVSQHAFLLRLTPSRFKSLRKQALLVESGKNFRTWTLEWRPSSKELRKHPEELSPNMRLTVRLHEIVIHPHLTLWFVTDLSAASSALADLYERRTHVETDLRNLKIVLQAECNRARSLESFQKEFWMSIVSYNLVSRFRCQAAAKAKVAPRRLSFKRTWTTFRTFLLSAQCTTAGAWRKRYRAALSVASKHKLADRPGRRYEREAYSLRPKSNQFKKRSIKPHMLA